MRYVDVCGLRLSKVGLGTWQFGSQEWGYGEAYARDVAPALIRRAVELGITMIDTAEIYGPAHSERIIGEVLPQLPDEARTELTVATKFMPVAPLEQFVAWQAAGSRRRLGVDALDLYYAHWPNPFVSPRRVMQSVRPHEAQARSRRAPRSSSSAVAAPSTLSVPPRLSDRSRAVAARAAAFIGQAWGRPLEWGSGAFGGLGALGLVREKGHRMSPR